MRLHKAFVVTPPSLGDRRLARFEKHMKMLHPEFPPLEIAEGVNKNWINFSDAPEFIPLFVDNRDIWTKFKIGRGLEKNAIPFRGSGIADLFTLGDKAIWIGAIGSAVGHIRAWREITKLPGPAVVFEDDRLLKQSVVLTNLPEPCDSNYLITLIPSAVGFTQKIEYDDTYWEITKTRGELAEIKESFLTTTQTYRKGNAPLGSGKDKPMMPVHTSSHLTQRKICSKQLSRCPHMRVSMLRCFMTRP